MQATLLTLRTKKGEIIEIRRLACGKYVCPVCGYLLPGDPWSEYSETDESGAPVGEPYAAGSQDICLSCGTQFGNDDVSMDGQASVNQMWQQLRDEWLKRVGWSSELEKQLAHLLDSNRQA